MGKFNRIYPSPVAGKIVAAKLWLKGFGNLRFENGIKVGKGILMP